ncbi:hypothetical protein M378DRAFT_584690 [Amanita muscaria Koide BX008]|uniref:Uncharacterized protein n=1 Tax=Amanita muscaria (strain Koide BX008) TaxID=946122 RepID=A0A0C2SNM0_AMAMK|nr:hypothetical protein M378DRAFT_584690 [Amanita muscaria Koide BX008]
MIIRRFDVYYINLTRVWLDRPKPWEKQPSGSSPKLPNRPLSRRKFYTSVN